jgi:hypothetical protein
MAEKSELEVTEMSPEDLLVYLISNKREREYKESLVRQILKTDVMITDDQLKHLYNMLDCLDKAFDSDRYQDQYVCSAKNYAQFALNAGLTDRRLIANIYKAFSTPQKERFFPKS